jgi:hypothetical protein
MNPIEELRKQKTYRIASELGIHSSVVDYVLTNNTAANAPYHNNQHLLTVANNVYDCGYHYGQDQHTLKLLFLAGLFHDFNHSVNKYKDQINVTLSVNGFIESLPYLNLQLSRIDIERICQLILATEYPHPSVSNVHELDATNKYMLRDADIIQTLAPDGNNFTEGLFIETGLRLSEEEKIKFIKSSIKTEWARKELNAYIQRSQL